MTEIQQAYISQVHLKGYKSIRDLSINLNKGLNIIIGANGTGKTNFLEGISNMQSFDYNDFTKETFNGKIDIYEYFEDNYNKLSIILEGVPNYKENLFIINERIRLNDNKEIQECEIRHNLITKNTNYNILKPYKSTISRYSVFSAVNTVKYGATYTDLNKGLELGLMMFSNHLHIHTTNNNVPYILIDYLYESIRNYNKIDENIKNNLFINKNLREKLKEFTPIKDIAIDNNAILFSIEEHDRYRLSNIYLKFLINNKWLYWHQISDGTKRLFYIFSNVLSDVDSQYILLEEPELGIHPDQLYKLMRFLKLQSQEKQIIITTHSPDVLNILNEDELDRIIITRFEDEKGTQMHHLSPTQVKKAQRYMKEVGHLSDYWVHSNLEAYENIEN